MTLPLRRSNAAKVFPGSEGHEATPDGDSAVPPPSNPAKVFPGSVPNAAKVFAGSGGPPRSAAAGYHDVITTKLDQRLSIQRVWQDLVAD